MSGLNDRRKLSLICLRDSYAEIARLSDVTTSICKLFLDKKTRLYLELKELGILCGSNLGLKFGQLSLL